MQAHNYSELPIELCRRAVAQIILTTRTTSGDSMEFENGEVLSVLSDFLAFVVQRLLRQAGGASIHANRVQLNIFDVLRVLPFLRLNVLDLINFLAQSHHTMVYSALGPKLARTGRIPTSLTLLPPGRSLLRAHGDDEEDDDDVGDQRSRMGPRHEQAPRPAYLTDIYPPLPRPYTFRRTETRGVRESDKVLIAKARAEQQRQVESNLFRLLAKTNALPEFVNCDDEI